MSDSQSLTPDTENPLSSTSHEQAMALETLRKVKRQLLVVSIALIILVIAAVVITFLPRSR